MRQFMNANAQILLLAFLEASAEGGYVTFGRRGGDPGYIHVVPGILSAGERACRHLLIELYNGTVGVTEPLREAIGGQERPHARIQQDTLGYSAGPNYGRFGWALPWAQIERDPRAFARQAIDAVLRVVVPVVVPVADDGDYL